MLVPNNFFALIQSGVLACVIWQSIRLIRTQTPSMTALFFAFAMISMLASDLYWIVYLVIRPEQRMPFAVNEIGEWAVFLLLSAALSATFQNCRLTSLHELIPPLLFAAANTALWIAWSGEWVQDIITGIVLGYLFCKIVYALLTSEALGNTEWTALGILAVVLIILQALTFTAYGSVKQMLDLSCYVLIFAGITLSYVKTIHSFLTGARARSLFSICCLDFAWCIICMYMSAEPMYFAAETAMTGTLIMMALSVRRVVEEVDLC